MVSGTIMAVEPMDVPTSARVSGVEEHEQDDERHGADHVHHERQDAVQRGARAGVPAVRR